MAKFYAFVVLALSFALCSASQSELEVLEELRYGKNKLRMGRMLFELACNFNNFVAQCIAHTHKLFK